MLNLIIRTFVIYVVVIAVMRLMGKRQIGQLQPFEMVISIIIADLAAMPMQDEKIPLIRGIIPLVVLLFAQVLFSFIIFRSKTFRTWLNGTPSVLIAGGKINHTTLQNCMVSFSDLLEAMHKTGISSLGDIDFAILETDGNISCFPKPSIPPIQNPDTAFSLPIIMNGKFLENYMQFSSQSHDDILSQIQLQSHTLDDVIYACIEPDGGLQLVYKRSSHTREESR